jgi:hypothetical protein
VLHSRESSAVAHRLIERVAGRGRAEEFAVARAEALDRLFIQQCFGRGKEGEARHITRRALGGGIEAAQRLDLVAEEIEAQRLLRAAGIEIDDAAAHRIFARVMHRVRAAVTVGLQQRREPVDRDALPRREAGNELAHTEGCQGLLGDRCRRGEHELRPLDRSLQCMKPGEALRGGTQRGRGAVIGQAIPCRDGDDIQLRGEPARRVRHRLHFQFVRRDEHRAGRGIATGRRTREVAHQQRQEAGGHA